jgi:cytochrome P450
MSTQQKFDYPSMAHAQCPFPMLAQIRAEGSVHRIADNRFLVSHYDDVEFVFRHPELFSNNSEERQQPFDWPGPDGVPPETLAKNGHVLNVIELDPPHHKRRRDRMFRFVKPARLASFRPWIAELVDQLIDGFIDTGRVELMAELAYPLPTQVIIRILGFDPEDFDWMHAWGTVEWPGGALYMTADEVARQTPKADSAGPLVTERILERVENPRDDGLTEMIQAQIEDDGAFNLGIVRADLGQFVRAGITTTGHLIGSAMALLLEHEDVMQEMVADHSRLRPMLEEALRLESPLQWIPRIACTDVELGGVMIPAGSYIILMIQSANRDEAKWGCTAAEFDPDRGDVIDHLGFGKGIHFCLGAPLGRVEAQIAFERLLTRLANIRLADGRPPRRIDSPTFRGLEGLRLAFDRAPEAVNAPA